MANAIDGARLHKGDTLKINGKLLFCWLALAATQAWAQEATDIVQQHCARCHGLDGIATQPDMPHLNGQQETYLIDVMNKFQRGRQPTEVPDHIAKTLNTGHFEIIARHYAASNAVRPKQETDLTKAKRGEMVYSDRCTDCHGDNGREADKNAPIMAAQNLNYLIAQTKLFISGKRKFGFLQDEAFRDLSTEELEAAAHFFASQEQFVAKPKGKKMKR